MKTAIVVIATLLLFACDQGAQSPRGFSLPEGNMEKGYLVFKKYQCQDCHRIAGEKESDNAQYLVAKPIPLGGSSGRIQVGLHHICYEERKRLSSSLCAKTARRSTTAQ